MEVQAEIHFVPSKDKPLSKSTCRLINPRDGRMNSVRQARRSKDQQKLAEQIEVFDDQGAPVIHKVENSFLLMRRSIRNINIPPTPHPRANPGQSIEYPQSLNGHRLKGKALKNEQQFLSSKNIVKETFVIRYKTRFG